jgi:hypothetical protein
MMIMSSLEPKPPANSKRPPTKPVECMHCRHQSPPRAVPADIDAVPVRCAVKRAASTAPPFGSGHLTRHDAYLRFDRAAGVPSTTVRVVTKRSTIWVTNSLLRLTCRGLAKLRAKT